MDDAARAGKGDGTGGERGGEGDFARVAVRLDAPVVLSVPSSSLRYMPVVSPRSADSERRKLGPSKVKVATPVVPSRERVSFTSGTTGSGTPTINSMYAGAAVTADAAPASPPLSCIDGSRSTRNRAGVSSSDDTGARDEGVAGA